MAKAITFKSGSPLIGSPIVYAVQASTVSATSGTVAFHRVYVQVHAGLAGGDYADIVLSSPVDSGETVNIDISSALRSVADQYEYTSEPATYPYIAFSLKAWDEYMENGSLHENVEPVTLGTDDAPAGYALMGEYSDLDRLLAGDTKNITLLSRKPSTRPETLCAGETFVYPTVLSNVTLANVKDNRPQSVAYDVVIDADNPEGFRTLGGRKVYVIPKQRDRYQFRFINRLGVMESIGVFALRETSVGITRNDYVRATQETFGSFSRYLSTKKNDAETWKLSSGPVDEAWQQWFLHEFLMTEHAWINVNGHWLPVIILPEDTVSGMNRHEHRLLEVQFSVKFDMNGSPTLLV